jgi:hypothetical protein
MYYKPEVLQAFRQILQEYKDKTHNSKISDCSLCRIYDGYHLCTGCPMLVFENKMCVHTNCMMRRCRPVNCYDSREIANPEMLAAVVEFYELAVERLKGMKQEELDRLGAFGFLVDLDNEVADRHGLKMGGKSILFHENLLSEL